MLGDEMFGVVVSGTFLRNLTAVVFLGFLECGHASPLPDRIPALPRLGPVGELPGGTRDFPEVGRMVQPVSVFKIVLADGRVAYSDRRLPGSVSSSRFSVSETSGVKYSSISSSAEEPAAPSLPSGFSVEEPGKEHNDEELGPEGKRNEPLKRATTRRKNKAGRYFSRPL